MKVWYWRITSSSNPSEVGVTVFQIYPDSVKVRSDRNTDLTVGHLVLVQLPTTSGVRPHPCKFQLLFWRQFTKDIDVVFGD